MAKQEITCDDILRELKARQYRPIYYLMGEEPYYIDLISDYIKNSTSPLYMAQLWTWLQLSMQPNAIP